MKPSTRFILAGCSLVLLAILATVLVWLLLQDVFKKQADQNIEAGQELPTMPHSADL